MWNYVGRTCQQYMQQKLQTLLNHVESCWITLYYEKFPSSSVIWNMNHMWAWPVRDFSHQSCWDPGRKLQGLVQQSLQVQGDAGRLSQEEENMALDPDHIEGTILIQHVRLKHWLKFKINLSLKVPFLSERSSASKPGCSNSIGSPASTSSTTESSREAPTAVLEADGAWAGGSWVSCSWVCHSQHGFRNSAWFRSKI